MKFISSLMCFVLCFSEAVKTEMARQLAMLTNNIHYFVIWRIK
jgi:hypothetical protein